MRRDVHRRADGHRGAYGVCRSEGINSFVLAEAYRQCLVHGDPAQITFWHMRSDCYTQVVIFPHCLSLYVQEEAAGLARQVDGPVNLLSFVGDCHIGDRARVRPRTIRTSRCTDTATRQLHVAPTPLGKYGRGHYVAQTYTSLIRPP